MADHDRAEPAGAPGPSVGAEPAGAPGPSVGAKRTETAQTLDRGLQLLYLVADAPGGVTVSEASARLRVGRAVIYRLASTLAAHALIRRDSAGRLRLGAGMLHLARRAQPMVAAAALPALRRLAEKVGATAHLTVAEGEEGVALVVVEPSWTQFHVAYRTGSRHPLDLGAAGRAILAGRRGETGCLATAGELQPGAYGVAAPVPGLDALEASVGVVALAALDAESVGEYVLRAAAEVAEALS